MKIMIDTNVIISSLLKQGSVPDIVLNYVCNNHDLILCDHIINECYTVARLKKPHVQAPAVCLCHYFPLLLPDMPGLVAAGKFWLSGSYE